MEAALIKQLVQLIDVAAGVGQVGEPVEGPFISLVGERPQRVTVNRRFTHRKSLQPCPWGKVKWEEDTAVLTIGQLASYAGVTTKTIRVYHAKGLLPEPDRDASGYRRYTAQHAVVLIKVRTLAEAGVPLARIAELTIASGRDFSDGVQRIDHDLTARIRKLRETQRRLRQLAAGTLQLLPADVADHLRHLPALGFSPRWVALETDLWILVFATHPETGPDLFHDQAQALSDPKLRQIYLDYDQAHDLDPADPRIEDLAARILAASTARYQADGPPGQNVDSQIPSLIQNAVNASSPPGKDSTTSSADGCNSDVSMANTDQAHRRAATSALAESRRFIVRHRNVKCLSE